MTTELSGVDLARQALVAAREVAKKNGSRRKELKRRTGTVVRRDGREPLGLGAAISMMMTERGMVAPAAGGIVLAEFDTIPAAVSPELAGHVQAVKLDPDTGHLDIVPNAPVYGTKLRWLRAEADHGRQREGARRARSDGQCPAARVPRRHLGGPRRTGPALICDAPAGEDAGDRVGRLPTRA